MAWFKVVIDVLVRRKFIVEADDPTDAIKRAWRLSPVEESELREDVREVTEMTDDERSTAPRSTSTEKGV